MAVHILPPDPFGAVPIKSVKKDGSIHRRLITPGTLEDGKWRDTDISEESAKVQAACREAWTDSVRAKYEAFLRRSVPKQFNGNI